MKVSAQYASQHFEDLALAVDKGEVVEIARDEKPTLKLISSVPKKSPKQVTARMLGKGKALTHVPSNEELDLIDREWKTGLDAKVFSR